MSWAAGTFTRVYGNTGWQDDAAAAIGIQADLHDTNDKDLADGINACLTKDGTNTPTANLPMGGYKHTGVANASANNEYMAFGQIKNGTPLYVDTANNRLGINTTSPAASLEVQSTETPAVIARYSADSTGPTVFLRKSRNASLGGNTIVQSGDQLGILDFRGANGTGFSSGATIRAVVDGTPGATNDMPGKVIIATSPDGAASPVDRVEIESDGVVNVNSAAGTAMMNVKSASGLIALTTIGGSATDKAIEGIRIIKGENNVTTAQYYVSFAANNGATNNGLITGNGTNQATFTNSSDERLKDNIVNLPSQYSALKSLRPVEFDYKDGSGHQIGFIAQEVQPIYPDLVSEGQDGYLQLSGLGKNEARLVKGFQEIASALEGALARIAVLEAKLA